jgi:hypothetical protein
MIRVLQSLLALISLLLLAWMADKANSAPWQQPDAAWQSDSAQPAVSPRPRLLPAFHRLAPAAQPGSHLQGQPYAYGYFGAKAQPMAAFHRSSSGDWFQWSVRRAD